MTNIYKITNTINGKIYVGKTVKTITERFQIHKKHARNRVNRYLYDAINKYGEDKFIVEPLEIVTGNGDIEEKKWIRILDSNNKEFGYNMTAGGGGGRMPDHILKVIADKKRGVKLTDEHKRKISQGNMGKRLGIKMTDDEKRKISETLKEKYASGEITANTPNLSGENHPMFGNKHTKEAREKMSNFRLGKTYEEIYGCEKAAEMKETKRNKCGENSHSWKTIDLTNLKELIDLNPEITIKEHISSLHLDISWPTILSKFETQFGIKIGEYRKKFLHENTIKRRC